MMDGQASKPLNTPPKAANQATALASKTLTYADLLFLLREDDNVRALIRDVAGAPPAADLDITDEADDVADGDEPPNHSAARPPLPSLEQAAYAADALREQLRTELKLLRMVQADAEIAADWLGEQIDEGRQLLQLVVCAAQWDVLSDLWDKLASRCKQQQRVASSEELYILQTALALHNLRWRGRQARLVDVVVGTTYDYERHQRGATTGDCVRAQWLPGLVNAGGQLQKKPLVQT
jgi:hypothetical protein